MNYQEARSLNLASSDLDRHWGVVAACTLGLALSLGTLLVYTFGVFVRPLSMEFGWSRTQLSLGLAVSQYSLACALPFWGYAVDRFGPRRLLLPGVVCLSALVASLSLLTSNILQYYIVFALISFTAGIAAPIGYCAVLVRRFDRHLGLALGLALMGVGIGAAILPPLSQALIAAFGWRMAYVALGGLTLVLTFPAALYATRGLATPPRPLAGAAKVQIRPLVLSPVFLMMSAAFFLLGLASIGTLANFVPIMIHRGYQPGVAAQFASCIGITAIVGRGSIGWLMDRIYPPYVVSGITFLGLVAFLLLAYADGVPAAYASAFLLGMLVGAEVDFVAYFVRRYFGNAVFGRLYGVAFAIFIFGNGTGPVLGSYSIDRFGSYQPAMLLFAAASLVIIVIMLTLPVRRIVRPSHVEMAPEGLGGV